MNIVPIDMNTPAAGSMLDYALKYANMGWHVFPVWGGKEGKCKCRRLCQSPGKHPVSHLVPRGQDDATTDTATIRRWWAQMPDAGIAVFLQPSGLMAIDIDPRNGGFETIDDIEAKNGALVSDVLQFTQSGGEHRIFKVAESINLPGKLGAGVDVKRNGYIVLHPTQGVAGKYDWEASSDPLDGMIPSPMPDWLRDLSAPDMAVVSSAGSRYVTPQQVAELSEALTFIPSDERDMWLRIGMALHSIGQAGFNLWDTWSRESTKYDPVDQIRVWRSFKSGKLNYESVFFVAAEFGFVNQYAPKIEMPAPVAEAEITPYVAPKSPSSDVFSRKIPIPELQAIADWMGGLYDEPTPAISQAGAIALASVVTGRVYCSEEDNWTSLMLVVSGSSGIGKNYIKTGVERLLLGAGLGNLVSGDFYTHQSAIYWSLNRAPTHICISDEFGENFLEARKNNNSNKLTVFKAIKKVYSDADHMFKSESYSRSNQQQNQEDMKPVLNPSLTLIGLTTPMQFYSEIKTSHLESGLINRFIIVNVEEGQQVAKARHSKHPPESLTDLIKQVRRVDDVLKHTSHDIAPTPVLVKFSPGAKRLFTEFRHTQKAACNDLKLFAGMESMPIRWRENAMRLATALAPWRNSDHPVVDEDIADFAINYVEYWGRRSIEIIKGETSQNDYEQRLSLVLNFIRDVNDPDGVNKSAIQRKFRSIKARELEEILAHLAGANLIAQLFPSFPATGAGRKASFWKAVAEC